MPSHGPVPVCYTAKLKIAAKQQLEHTGPRDLSFISLNQGGLEGWRQLKGKEEKAYSCLYFLPDAISCPFSKLLSHLPPHLSPFHPACPRQEGREGAKERRQERKKKLELLRGSPSPAIKFHIILSSSQSSHWSFHCEMINLYQSRENIRHRLQVVTGEGKKGITRKWNKSTNS